MPINHADGTIFVSVPFYPIAAGIGAAHGGAGWFAIFYVPAGLAVGLAMARVGRALVYGVLGYGLSRGSAPQNRWLRNLLAAPFLLLYMLMPPLIAWGGVFGVWAGSVWLAQNL